MRTFVQQLESRTLFAATPLAAVGLVTDLAAIAADLKSVKTTLAASGAAFGPDLKKLSADLRAAGGAENLALAKKLVPDANKTFAVLRGVMGRLTGPVMGASARSVAHGVALARKPGAAGIARVQADIALLGNILTAPLTNAANALAASAIADDVTTAGTLNPSDDVIAADLAKITADQATFGAFTGAAQSLLANLTKLGTDLGALVA